MGFFSYNCKGCGHSLLSGYATNAINRWMTDGVAIQRDGALFYGGYDGYGRLDGEEFADDSTVWHDACWNLSGRPLYDGASECSDDQGYFFDAGAHDEDEPTTVEEMHAIKLRLTVAHELRRRSYTSKTQGDPK